MNKEGLAASSLVLIILSVVSGITLLLVSVQISSQNQAALEENCRTSVLQRIAVESLSVPGDWSSYSSLRCSSFDMGTISGDRPEVKQEIADLAARCWYMYAEGRSVSVFEESSVDSCVICYTFNLDEDIGEYDKSQRRLIFDESAIEFEMTEEVDRDDPSINNYDTEGNPVSQERFLGSNMIPYEEMFNYLLTTKYDPGLIRGGGVGDYMSGYKDFDYEVESEFGLNLLNASLNNGVNEYVFDFTDDKEIGKQINATFEALGSNLLENGKGQLYVVIANSVGSTSKGAVNTFIESRELNSPERKNAVVVVVDLEKGYVRVTMGKNLERFITEPVLHQKVQNTFENIYAEEDLISALNSIGGELNNDISYDQENEILEELGAQDTYYSYISNRGVHTPLIGDINQHGVMGVAFGTKGHGFFSDDAETVIVTSAVALGAGITIALLASGGWAAVPLLVGGTIGGGISGGLSSWATGWLEGENPVETNIIIGPMSELIKNCERL